jgi:hypothetical protein
MTSPKRKSKSSPSSRRPRARRGSTSRVSHPRRVALAKVKDDLSRYLRLAESEDSSSQGMDGPREFSSDSDLKRTGLTTDQNTIPNSFAESRKLGWASRPPWRATGGSAEVGARGGLTTGC